MEETKIGFIGAGNMAQATVKGLLSSGLCACTSLHALIFCFSKMQENHLQFLRQPLRKRHNPTRK